MFVIVVVAVKIIAEVILRNVVEFTLFDIRSKFIQPTVVRIEKPLFFPYRPLIIHSYSVFKTGAPNLIYDYLYCDCRQQ